jgi:pseudouridine synthase
MRKSQGGLAQDRSGLSRDQVAKAENAAVKAGKRSRNVPMHPPVPGTPERINKALARAGVASRRAVDKLIRDGEVAVNGQVVTELGTKVDPRQDRVLVKGKRVPLVANDQQVKLYFLLNKPAGVITSAKDDVGRKTVMDLVAGANPGRIYPVGRLDYDAEGALLLTNDGELAALLMAPRKHIPKVYQVKVKGSPPEEKLDILRRGVRLEDGVTQPCDIRVIRRARVNTWVEVTLMEGKNRQLKRMFWAIHHPVMKILRVAFGSLELGDLPVGRHRALTEAEVDLLRAQVQGV